MAFKSWIYSEYSCFEQTRRLLEASGPRGRSKQGVCSKQATGLLHDRSPMGCPNVILHCFRRHLRTVPMIVLGGKVSHLRPESDVETGRMYVTNDPQVTYFSATRRFSNSNSSFLDEREAFSLRVTSLFSDSNLAFCLHNPNFC